MSAQPTLFDLAGAVFSECQRYRYRLWRGHEGSTVAFIGLNPSTAGAKEDDPTVRRWRGFTHASGFTRFVAVNLYAWRATDPRDLRFADDPIGPENDSHILNVCCQAQTVVACWGHVNGPARDRAAAVSGTLLAYGITLHALAVNANGSPAHPLYLPKSARPVEWRVP